MHDGWRDFIFTLKVKDAVRLHRLKGNEFFPGTDTVDLYDYGVTIHENKHTADERSAKIGAIILVLVVLAIIIAFPQEVLTIILLIVFFHFIGVLLSFLFCRQRKREK